MRSLLNQFVLSSVVGLAAIAAKANSGDRVIAGPSDAKVTIEEFADFECSYCSKGASTVQQLLKDYDGKVNLIFRNMPLDFHSHALPAAKAFAALQIQKPVQAFAFYSKVFQNQQRLHDEGVAFLLEVAGSLGADTPRLKVDMEGPEVARILQEDKARGESLHFKGTPSFRIGSESLVGAQPYEEFKKVIDRQL